MPYKKIAYTALGLFAFALLGGFAKPIVIANGVWQSPNQNQNMEIASSRTVRDNDSQVFVRVLQSPQPTAYTLKNGEYTQDEPLLKDINGKELQQVIKSYEGERAVLVNVWATWCAPCIEEFPDIVKLQRKYEDRLRVIFISTDFPEGREKALKFLKEQNVDWTTYFKTGNDQQFIEAISKEWTGAMPFTKIINKQGEIVASWENSASFSKFDKHVKQALNL